MSKIQIGGSKREIGETKQKHLATYLQDVIALLLLGGLLFYGSFWEMFDTVRADPALYQCYAVAFWQGWSGLQELPSQVGSPTVRCTLITHPDRHLTGISQDELVHTMQRWRLPSSLVQFVAAQSPDQPYHSLPREYPASALLVFSLGLIAPAHWYGVAYAIWMILLIGCVYLVLLRWRSRQAALAYSLYLVAGGSATAASRLDMLPAALTLFALICTVQKHWNWAFALLALATLTKFYPVILLVPFFLALQRGVQGEWYGWRRWQPVVLFVGICVLGFSVSLLLSVVGTLAPLRYFANRPVLVETLPASVLWILSLLGKTSLTYVGSFGTSNVLSSLSSNVMFLMTVLLVIGLISTWYLQWRRRMDLAMACLVTLLIMIVTGKVFSPQYLIWVIPLAAYAGQSNPWWLLSWTLIGLLTTWIYPSIYRMSWAYQVGVTDTPLFYPVSVGRSFLFLGFIAFVLIFRSRLDHPASHDKEQVEQNPTNWWKESGRIG